MEVVQDAAGRSVNETIAVESAPAAPLVEDLDVSDDVIDLVLHRPGGVGVAFVPRVHHQTAHQLAKHFVADPVEFVLPEACFFDRVATISHALANVPIVGHDFVAGGESEEGFVENLQPLQPDGGRIVQARQTVQLRQKVEVGQHRVLIQILAMVET